MKVTSFSIQHGASELTFWYVEQLEAYFAIQGLEEADHFIHIDEIWKWPKADLEDNNLQPDLSSWMWPASPSNRAECLKHWNLLEASPPQTNLVRDFNPEVDKIIP